MKAVLLTSLVILASSTPSSAKCRFNIVHFFYGSDLAQTAEADSGRECSTTFDNSRGAGMTSIQVVRQPKHGVATWNGSVAYAKVTYKSAPGYTGPDDFVYAITGASAKRQGTANIAVSLVVD